MKKIIISIFGTNIECLCSSDDIMIRLKKDFHSFIIKNNDASSEFKFEFHLGDIPWGAVNGLRAYKQTSNCITYVKENIAYNDYHGKAFSVYDFKENTASIYSSSVDHLHELAYLLILSRSGKWMDINGFHKIHAMGVSFGEKALIITMPMKGGKSSLFIDIIKDKSISIISDDTPVIDGNGNVHPFPLRIGVSMDEKLSQKNEEQSYQMERRQFGPKKLIPVNCFKNEISSIKTKVILMNGIRIRDKICRIERVTFLELLWPLIKNMVIGIGLPMVIEYFLEPRYGDWPVRLKILLKRIKSMIRLSFKSKKYNIYLGTDRKVNTERIHKFIKKHG